jgi:hypothetical protein
MSKVRTSFPPYQMLTKSAEEDAAGKTRRLERLYHLTQQHAWDGKQVLGSLVEQHGPPGAGMPRDKREALSRVLTVLMWGELAAWNISADLALGIEDMDAKMAATAQVFDEARHFYVMKDYVTALGEVPPLWGIPRRLLSKVLDAPTLATKLVGMQLLFETNAVVIFRRLGESGVCPILAELMPYFERDESRHVGLGVMYVPKLIEKMSRAEAARTAHFQFECIMLLMAGGFVIRDDFEALGLDQRLMATRVTTMQDDIVRQMAAAHGRGVLRALLTPKGGFGPKILDFIHPPAGMAGASSTHRRVHRGLQQTFRALDRALA